MLIILIMARPKKNRRIRCNPAAFYFKPRGIPMNQLEEIFLEADELEAIRLGDFLSLSQEEAAVKMDISRATFGRIINRARQKVAEGIINGKAIRISEVLAVQLRNKFMIICKHCGYKFQTEKREQTTHCPNCNSI